MPSSQTMPPMARKGRRTSLSVFVDALFNTFWTEHQGMTGYNHTATSGSSGSGSSSGVVNQDHSSCLMQSEYVSFPEFDEYYSPPLSPLSPLSPSSTLSSSSSSSQACRASHLRPIKKKPSYTSLWSHASARDDAYYLSSSSSSCCEEECELEMEGYDSIKIVC